MLMSPKDISWLLMIMVEQRQLVKVLQQCFVSWAIDAGKKLNAGVLTAESNAAVEKEV